MENTTKDYSFLLVLAFCKKCQAKYFFGHYTLLRFVFYEKSRLNFIYYHFNLVTILNFYCLASGALGTNSHQLLSRDISFQLQELEK